MTIGIALAPWISSPLKVLLLCGSTLLISAPIPFNTHMGTDSNFS